jgi:uncharacterized membrane protein YphA (DoxX/SURF4 family)
MDIWEIGEWAGKIVIAAFFVLSGGNHLLNHKNMSAYAQSKKVPLAPVAVAVEGLMMIAGAVMILLRWHTIWGTGLLVLFLVPKAFVIHNFWVESDPMAKSNQQAHFLKNLAIAAGLVLYAVAVHRGAF